MPCTGSSTRGSMKGREDETSASQSFAFINFNHSVNPELRHLPSNLWWCGDGEDNIVVCSAHTFHFKFHQNLLVFFIVILQVSNPTLDIEPATVTLFDLSHLLYYSTCPGPFPRLVYLHGTSSKIRLLENVATGEVAGVTEENLGSDWHVHKVVTEPSAPQFGSLSKYSKSLFDCDRNVYSIVKNGLNGGYTRGLCFCIGLLIVWFSEPPQLLPRIRDSSARAEKGNGT